MVWHWLCHHLQPNLAYSSLLIAFHPSSYLLPARCHLIYFKPSDGFPAKIGDQKLTESFILLRREQLSVEGNKQFHCQDVYSTVYSVNVCENVCVRVLTQFSAFYCFFYAMFKPPHSLDSSRGDKRWAAGDCTYHPRRLLWLDQNRFHKCFTLMLDAQKWEDFSAADSPRLCV